MPTVPLARQCGPEISGGTRVRSNRSAGVPSLNRKDRREKYDDRRTLPARLILSGDRSGLFSRANFFADDGRDFGPQQFNGAHHLPMRDRAAAQQHGHP